MCVCVCVCRGHDRLGVTRGHHLKGATGSCLGIYRSSIWIYVYICVCVYVCVCIDIDI